MLNILIKRNYANIYMSLLKQLDRYYYASLKLFTTGKFSKESQHEDNDYVGTYRGEG